MRNSIVKHVDGCGRELENDTGEFVKPEDQIWSDLTWGKHRDKQNVLLSQIYDSFYRVRSIGSGSLSLAWLSQGHFGAYFSWGLTEDKYSDIAAGLLIAEEAGAVVRIIKIHNEKSAVAVGSVQTTDFLLSLIPQDGP